MEIMAWMSSTLDVGTYAMYRVLAVDSVLGDAVSEVSGEYPASLTVDTLDDSRPAD